MFRRTILSSVAAIALSAVALPLAAQDTLRIGVEGAYPPFSSKESDGTLIGFDIDIAKALCAEMQRECELVEQEWDGAEGTQVRCHRCFHVDHRRAQAPDRFFRQILQDPGASGGLQGRGL